MTSVLAELQAGYEQRAQIALEPLQDALDREYRPKATRTYTGEQLERRKAWGRLWGALNAEHARKLRAGEVG